MRARNGTIIIQREAPPEKVGAIFIPTSSVNRCAYATVIDSKISWKEKGKDVTIPVGVRAICTLEMGEKVDDYTLFRDITSVYGWFEDGELKLPPNRIAVLAKKDEHENDFIYVPGNFLRRDEAIGSKQRWVRGEVFASTHPDVATGDQILYYEAAETMNLDRSDWDQIPEKYELRFFPNRKYEPIDAVVCRWTD